MLNTKSLLTKITQSIGVVDSNSTTMSLEASGTGVAEIDMSKSGYKLIGIVGVKTEGTGSSLGYLYTFFIDPDNPSIIRVYFRNTTATARTYTVVAYGMYIKVGG